MGATGDKIGELHGLLRQIEASGTTRRAVIFHLDRLPAGTPKLHRQTLADIASGLAGADRGQHFLLPRGALAVVWRHHGEEEFRPVLDRIMAVMTEMPRPAARALGVLMTMFDLPEQSAALRAMLGAPAESPAHPGKMEIPLQDLTRLEAAVAQADLGPSLRRRPVVELGADGIWRTAWTMLHPQVQELTDALWPGPSLDLSGAPGAWLERAVQRRLLTRMTGTRALDDGGAFCLRITPGGILSADFASFDRDLPARLRGGVVLALRAADLVADGAVTKQALETAKAGQFRLLLEDGETGLLDPAYFRFDYVQIPAGAAERRDGAWDSGGGDLRAPYSGDDDPIALDRVVLSGVDRQEQLDWAIARGYRRVSGLAAA